MLLDRLTKQDYKKYIFKGFPIFCTWKEKPATEAEGIAKARGTMRVELWFQMIRNVKMLYSTR